MTKKFEFPPPTHVTRLVELANKKYLVVKHRIKTAEDDAECTCLLCTLEKAERNGKESEKETE